MKAKNIVIAASAAALAVSVAANIHFIAKEIRNACQSDVLIKTPPAPDGGKQTGSSVSAAAAVAANDKKIQFLSASLNGMWAADINFLTKSKLKQFTAPVTVTPELKDMDIDLSYKSIRIYGKFKPRTKYTVKIPAGLENTDGAKLEKPLEILLVTGDLTPCLEMAESAVYYPFDTKKTEILCSACNIDSITVNVAKTFKSNLGILCGNWNTYDDSFSKKTGSKKIKADLEKNKTTTLRLDISDLVTPGKAGVYHITLYGENGGEPAYTGTGCTLIVSDLGIQSVRSEDGESTAVFVRSLSGNAPAGGAEVVLFSEHNQQVGKGITDKSGSVLIKTDGRPAVAAVSKGGDFNVLLLNDMTCVAKGTAPHDKDSPSAFVFTERGICRPGEDFTVSVFVRNGSDPAKTVGNAPFTLKIYDPSNNLFLMESLATDKYGFAEKKISLPKNASVGTYTITCGAGDSSKWGTAGIQVGAFVPDTFKVEAKRIGEEPLSMDSKVDFSVDAGYYFGSTVDSGSCTMIMWTQPRTTPLSFWPKGWAFGDCDSFTAGNVQESRTGVTGKAIRTTYNGAAASGCRSFNPISVIFSASVAIPGGRSVSDTASALIMPSAFFIGMKDNGSSAPDRKSFQFRLLPAIQGKTCLEAGAGITFSLFKIEYRRTLKRKGSTYSAVWEREAVERRDLRKTISVPQGTDTEKFQSGISFAGLESGEYELVAECGKDIRTKISFMHYSGEAGLRSKDPAVLFFKTDNAAYAPGSTATVAFESTVDGAGCLVSGEKNISEIRSFDVKQGKNEVKINIPHSVRSGSFFAGITVVAGKDYPGLQRASGMAELKVDQAKAHRLSVAIGAPQYARPGETANVTIKVSGSSGAPKAGLAKLFAVDEGILVLTDYRTPDIFGYFYGKRPSPFSFHDLYGLLYPELGEGAGTVFGGGDSCVACAKISSASIKEIRMKRSAVTVLPPVEIPENGTAETKITFPAHTGAMRIMAVVSGEDCAGSSQTDVTLREPLTATCASPRYVTTGDKAELVFTAFNHSMPDGAECTLKAVLPPELEFTDGEKGEFAFTLKKDASLSFVCRVRATGKQGDGKISWTISSGGVSVSDHTFVTWRPLSSPQTFRTVEMLKPGGSAVFEYPAADYDGAPSCSVKIASSPAAAVSDALSWLNSYPYGCLEQTVSGAFPFLALDNMVKAGLITPEYADANRHKLLAAYASILPMYSKWPRGFSMWPDSGSVWRDGTLYASHFIFECERAGIFTPDKRVRSGLLDFLRGIPASPEFRLQRAYASYILALAGDELFINTARNIVSTGENDYAAFLAGAAMITGGYASEGVAPVKAALAAHAWGGAAGKLEISSESALAGMTLFILSKIKTGDIGDIRATLALRLAETLKNDSTMWGTTQSNAWAVLGLSSFAAEYPPSKVSCTVATDGKETHFDAPADIPLTSNAVVTNDSDSPLMVIRTIKGTPLSIPERSGVVSIKRSFLDTRGNTVDKVRHGDTVFVRIDLKFPERLSNAVICDILPGGLEIEDASAGRRTYSPPQALAGMNLKCPSFHAQLTQAFDDRYLFFGDFSGNSENTLIYRTRAVTRGTFTVPETHAEGMYSPDVSGSFAPKTTFTVE